MTQTTDNRFNIVIVGHVDHGKSTLIGRLLYDTDSLEDGKYEDLQKICKARGTEALEWSFLLDSFQAERDQAVTIDTTQIWFSTEKRNYVIIDAPGHREFLKNMISGAAAADAAVLVVDGREGVQEQTRRHAYLLSLLGLTQIAVVINKMDMVEDAKATYESVSKDVEAYLNSIDLKPSFIVPISARDGDMIAERGDRMQWYDGKTLTEVFDSFERKAPSSDRPLRFPVQDVYRFGEDRIIVGRVETGTVKKGDTILFSPTNEETEITALKIWPDDESKNEAVAGEVIGMTLKDRIFVERGHIGSHDDKPPMLSNLFRMKLFWLSKEPLVVGNTYKIRYGTHETMANIQDIERVLDTEDLSQEKTANSVGKNAVAEVVLRSKDLLPVDDYTDNQKLGRAVLYDGYDIAGAGTIDMQGYEDQRQNAPKAQNIYKVDHLMTSESRALNKGHQGGVFWFTGLSGAGKSTLAMAVEKALYEKGYHSYVLDGDNVRHGLNADLGFSPEDRTENIRRIGEVAALMADAGLIVITAFISPYRDDRNRARAAAKNQFHELYISADLETCEERDPKGLYKKARAGEIAEFTGIDSPYEPPENPEIRVDTSDHNVDFCVRQILQYIEQQVVLKDEDEFAYGKEQAIGL